MNTTEGSCLQTMDTWGRFGGTTNAALDGETQMEILRDIRENNVT